MGTKNNPDPNDCYVRALPDEPLFTLLARDLDAPRTVEIWAEMRERGVCEGRYPTSDLAQVDKAYRDARKMRKWRDENDGKWRAPTPLLDTLETPQ